MNFLHIPSTTVQSAAYPPSDPAIDYTFPLDPFQQQAVLAIHRGDNVFVTAKTGSGKTLVGEYQIAYSLRKGKRIFYTTPIKSLTNQKYNDLKHLFPKASVGVMTGDIKSNPEADIVVLTTEVLRNLLFKESTTTARLGVAGALSMENVDAVIFDEVHYINDPDRGHVWEETLILLKPEIHLILLSATIDAPEAFATWLGNAKQRPIVLLQTTHRVVPLIHGVYDPTVPGALPLQPLKKGDEAPYMAEVYRAWLRGKEARAKAVDDWATRVRAATVAGDSIAGATGKMKTQSFTHTLNECIDQLKIRDLLPALFFVFSRKECERNAEQITGSLIDSSDTAAVKHIIGFHLHKYSATLTHLPQYHQLVRLLERGIAFHHSGLLPLLKEIVELLFSRGYIKVLFCTETFAVGLNMPTRTVVFLDLKKPADGGGFRCLRPDEYIQMAGRAGRRGKDTLGVVLYLPTRTPLDPEELRGVVSGSLVPLESRLAFHYDFLLKALHSNQADADVTDATDATVSKPSIWSTMIDASYWNAERRVAIAKCVQELTAQKEQRAALMLTPAEIVDLDEKTRLEASLKTLTNAARRKVVLALDRWKDHHMGPKWALAMQQYAKGVAIDTQCARIQASIDALETPIGRSRIDPLLGALEEWGALQPAAGTEVPKLTTFGILATEVNEGNSLLLAKLYESQALHGAPFVDIVGTLGAFIVDRESIEKTVHPRALPYPISDLVKTTLCTVDTWGQQGVSIDKQYGIESPELFWSLATLWTEIGTDWVLGTLSAAEIAQKYEIYEGNLMRGLHKLANLVNEWISMATYKADVDMLETLKDAQNILLRDIAQPESLYLRL